MIVHWVYLGKFGGHWSFVMKSGLGPQPVPCAARCVCWRDVLMEDKPGGQPAIA